jgi:hypothetical protein
VTKVEGLKVAGSMYTKELVEQTRVKTMLWLSARAGDDDTNCRFHHDDIVEVTLQTSYHYLQGKPGSMDRMMVALLSRPSVGSIIFGVVH